MNTLLDGLLALVLALPTAGVDEPKAEAPGPPVSIVLGSGQASATPFRQGSSRTGGGNIQVTQPAPDTLSVTMTGAAAAKRHPLEDSVAGLNFELSQGFEVVYHSSKVKGARLIMWGRTVGLLRSGCHCWKNGGFAETSTPGHASIHCGPEPLLALDLPLRVVVGGENLSIHDREGPVWVPISPGQYTLHQVFGVTAAHRKGFCCKKAASAEFAPDPALEDDWLGKREPFHGAAKENLGFQVILKVIADEEPHGENKKP